MVAGILKDRFTWRVVGGFLIAAAVIVAFRSVYLDAYDVWGFKINCGTAVFAQDAQADSADQQAGDDADFVQHCHTAILVQRATVLGLVLLGVGALAGSIPRGRPAADISDSVDEDAA